MVVCFLLYTIPIGMLLYVLIHKPARKYYVPVKCLASAAFICAAIYCGVKSDNIHMLIHMMPGFLMCFCGDVFLGFYNNVKNKKLFLGGVATFLLGHIFFLLTFIRIQKLSGLDFMFPSVALALTIVVTSQKRMHIGRLRPYVYVYSLFVSMLFSKSVHIVAENPTLPFIMAAIGSTLFLISDFLILFLYFYDKRPWTTHGWNLVTYYYGIFFLTLFLYTY